MEEGENEVEKIPYVERGELLVLWQLHRPELGNTVTITTGPLLTSALTCFISALVQGSCWIIDICRPMFKAPLGLSISACCTPAFPGMALRWLESGAAHMLLASHFFCMLAGK